MSYKVTMIESSEDSDYIRVEVSGSRVHGMEVKHAAEALNVINNKCKNVNKTKALAIMNLDGNMPFMSAYELGRKAEEYGWDRRMKIAAVYADKESLETMSFAETVTVNRGYQVRVFGGEDEAIRWLNNS